MNTAIAIIKDEHRSISAILKGLRAHLDDIKSGRTQPDMHLMAAMLDYIEAFPERQHHPKEDEYLFHYLRQRTTESHAILDELEAQHTRSGELLGALRRQLAAYRESGDVAAFDKALDDYAGFHWEHMRKEEEIVLPLAERYLTAADWDTIETAFQSNRTRLW